MLIDTLWCRNSWAVFYPLLNIVLKVNSFIHFVYHPYHYLKSLVLWNELMEKQDQINLLIKLKMLIQQLAASVPVSSCSWGWDLLSSINEGPQGSLIKPITVPGWCESRGRSWRNHWGSQVFITKTHSSAEIYANAIFFAGGPYQACHEKVIIYLLEWLLECPWFADPGQTKPPVSSWDS